MNDDDGRDFSTSSGRATNLYFQTVAFECFSACRDFGLLRHGKPPLDIQVDCQTGIKNLTV